MRDYPPFPGMHPVLAAWFARTFGEPTDIQRRAWGAVSGGSHALIAAPTGSGKTLAALLPCLNRLLLEKEVDAEAGHAAQAGVRILYITPLKALNNDIHHHVLGFTASLERVARETALSWPGVRSAVRTGDTKPAERASMLRKPPDLLVTTPESLFILLTSDKGRHMLHTVRQVIVDEIHDLAGDKRGAHLSLSLERLAEMCGGAVQRIGVSATQKPLVRVARYLGGWEEPAGDTQSTDATAAERSEEGYAHPLGYQPRPVSIVESDMVKSYAVLATIPDTHRLLQTRDAAVWLPLLERLMQLLEGSRSVLIYVNSRRLCERLCLRLNDHVGYEMARAHHGSMSREWRLEVERMLKSGELRCIVATSTLELGIDVGHVDYVLQIDPPPDAAAGIQRVGRAGHAVGDTSRGAIVVRNKGALPDAAVLARAIAERDIEEIEVPRDALSVLSQQTVAMASEGDRTVGELHRLIVRSDSYRGFPRDRLDSLLELQSGFYPFVRPLLDWDRATGVVSRRPNSAMAAISGAGTIPQSSSYPLHHAESRALLGELDEEFVHESRVGDVVQLGAQAWMIREIRHDRVYATEAGNRFSEVPFWRNESAPRPYPLGVKIGAFLRELEERLGQSEGDTLAWLDRAYGMDPLAAQELADYVRAQQAVSRVPTDRRLVVEHYRDAAGQKHVILLNPFGRRLNRTWLLAIERQLSVMLPYRVYGNAKDNGIELVFSEWDASWLHAIWQVTSSNAEALLAEALAGSPLLAATFRRLAETSLLLSRSYTRIPLWQKRLRGAELLKNALPYAERFPYFAEAMRETMREELDIDRLRELLEDIESGRAETVVRETEHPSPMAGQFLFDYVNMRIYEGDGLDEAVQLQLLQVSKSLAGQLFAPDGNLQAVDPEIVAEESVRLGTSQRAPQDAGDVLRLLKERGDLTVEELQALAGERAREWLEELADRGRAAPYRTGREAEVRWIAADEMQVYETFPDDPASVAFVLGRFVDRRISFTEEELISRYPVLQAEAASAAVDALLQQGLIEQAPFAADASERIWSSRKVAERLVRLSIGKARRSVEPVAPSRWLGHLLRRQYVLSGESGRGEEGLLAVIERLQGLYLPLSHWESLIFPARLPDYRKETLDLLCASGQVIWLGRRGEGDKEGKVAFFLADSRGLIEPLLPASGDSGSEGGAASGEPAEPTRHPTLLALLQSGGAKFLTKLSQELGQAPSETLAALLDLVWEGRVSNDQFAPLRQAAGSRSKDGFLKRGSGLGRWYWTGALAESAGTPAKDAALDDGDPPIVRWVHQLLQTYGLVTKELVQRACPYPWEAILPVLKRLENWGAVTRGLFIRDLPVLQFTTKELAESLRKPPADDGDAGAITLLSAVDPANPYGQAVDWPPGRDDAAFARKPGNYLVLQGGEWRYWIENGGKRIHAIEEPDRAENVEPGELARTLHAAFVQLRKRQSSPKIAVERWNGRRIGDTRAADVLRALGAEKDGDRFVLWPSQLREGGR